VLQRYEANGQLFRGRDRSTSQVLISSCRSESVTIPIGSHNHPSTTEVSPVFVFARQLNRTVRRSLISTQMRTD
jgi:hypothetical protein